MIVPMITFDLLMKRQWRKAVVYVTTSSVTAVLFYAVFGWRFGWGIFIEALHAQSFRLIGWSNPAFLFTTPGFHNKILLDFSFYVFLLLGVHFLLQNDHETSQNNRFLKVSILVSWAVLWMSSAEQDFLGWYRLPLFCFLAIAAGASVKAKKYWGLVVLMTITVVNNLGLVRFPTHPYPDAIVLRGVVIVAIGGVFLLLYLVQRKNMMKLVLGLLMFAYICQSFYVGNTYFAAQCRDRFCVTPTVTFAEWAKLSLHIGQHR